MLENFTRNLGNKAQRLELATELIKRARFLNLTISDETIKLLLESASELTKRHLTEAEKVSRGFKGFSIQRARVIHEFIRDEGVVAGEPLPIDPSLIKTQTFSSANSLSLRVGEIEPEPTEFLIRFILKFLLTKATDSATKEIIKKYLAMPHAIINPSSASFCHYRVGDRDTTPEDLLKEHAVIIAEHTDIAIPIGKNMPSFQNTLLAKYTQIIKTRNVAEKYAIAWDFLTERQRSQAHFLIRVPMRAKNDPSKKEVYLYVSFIF